MNYLDAHCIAANELLRKSIDSSYEMNEIGKAAVMVNYAGINRASENADIIAKLILAKYTSGLVEFAPYMLHLLKEAYNCGVIDGKRAERTKKK